MLPEALASYDGFALLLAAIVFFLRIERKLDLLIDHLKSLQRQIETGASQSTREHKELLEYTSRKFGNMEKDHQTLLNEQLKFHTEIRAKSEK